MNLSKSLFTQLVNDFDINHSSSTKLVCVCVCVYKVKSRRMNISIALIYAHVNRNGKIHWLVKRIWKWTIFKHDKSIKSIKLNKDIIECAPDYFLIINDSFETLPRMLFSCSIFFYLLCFEEEKNAKTKINWLKSISNKFT